VIDRMRWRRIRGGYRDWCELEKKRRKREINILGQTVSVVRSRLEADRLLICVEVRHGRSNGFLSMTSSAFSLCFQIECDSKRKTHDDNVSFTQIRRATTIDDTRSVGNSRISAVALGA